MTQALEVRMYWGDVLLAAELFDVRPGLHVAVSASGVGAAGEEAITVASYGAAGLELAGEADHGGSWLTVGDATFVMARCARPERAPLSAKDRALAAPMLAALAMHVAMLGAGMGSASSDLLALEPEPSPPTVRLPVASAGSATETASVHTSVSEAREADGAGVTTGPPRRRGGGRRSVSTARPDALALLGGIAARLGAPSDGAHYEASAALGAPMFVAPDEEGFGMGGYGVSCDSARPCANATARGLVLYGAHHGIAIPQPGEPAALAPRAATVRPSARCSGPGGRCVGRIRVCGMSLESFCGCFGFEVTGGLSREDVRRAVRARRNEMAFCFERELRGRPDLEGRVTSTFLIGPSGVVSTASATSDELPAVAECVQRVLSRITFPESDFPTAVSYPFAFDVVTDEAVN